MTQSHPPSQKLPPLTKQTEGDCHPPTHPTLPRGSTSAASAIGLQRPGHTAAQRPVHPARADLFAASIVLTPVQPWDQEGGLRSHPAKDPAPQFPAVRQKPECTILPYHHTERSTQDSGNTHTLSSNGSHGNDLFFRFFGIIWGHPGVLRAILKDTEHHRGVYTLSTIAQKNQDQSGS